MHFQPPHNEMKCVLCIEESYSKGKIVKIFTFSYGQAGSGDPHPPYGQPDRKIPVFFTPSLIIYKVTVYRLPGVKETVICHLLLETTFQIY